jgi:hypothetical protein
MDVPARKVWEWLTRAPLPSDDPWPWRRVRDEQGRYFVGWASAPVTIVEEQEPRLLIAVWEEDGDPATTLRWDITSHTDSVTTVTATHSGFTDRELAEAYRAEWHDTLIHIKRWHTRPTDPPRHREQQRRRHLTRLHAALTEVLRHRSG